MARKFMQKYLDIKPLIGDEDGVLQELTPAIEKYNKEQLATTTLPGGSDLVSSPPSTGGQVDGLTVGGYRCS